MRRTNLFAAMLAVEFLGFGPAIAASWPHWHGDPANSGFQNVETAPAVSPKVLEIGAVATGSGPVIGADGTVYVGLRAGQVVALTPNLDIKWRRDTQGQIAASPIIASDGSIFVLAVRTVRDHRGGQTLVRRTTSLHKFDSGGGLHWVAPLPADASGDGPYTTAPLNLWRGKEGEAIIVPVRRKAAGGHYNDIVALSIAGGAVIATVNAGYTPYFVTGGSGLALDCDSFFVVCSELEPRPGSTVPRGATLPMPGVALYSARGSDHYIVYADGYQNIRGYRFSPSTGFEETYHRHVTADERGLAMATPMMLADGHSVVRAYNKIEDSAQSPYVESQAWMLFAGPNPVTWPDYAFMGLGSTPAMLADGRMATAGTYYFRGDGAVIVLSNYEESDTFMPKSETLGPPVSSQNHVFVSFADRFVTLDAATMKPVAEFPWMRGGLSPPAIDGLGRIYAIAGESIYAFPVRTCVGPRCRLDAVRKRRPSAGAEIERSN